MEPERIHTGRCLIIDSAGDRYVLAMKLASGRRADEADCELLIRSLDIRSHGELLDLIEQAIPAHVQTPAHGLLRRRMPPPRLPPPAHLNQMTGLTKASLHHLRQMLGFSCARW